MPRPARPRVGEGDPRGFEPLIRRYLEDLGVHSYSERTLATAGSQLRIFAAWCEERGITRPVDVSRDMIERYQRWLYHYRQDDGRPLALGTQAGRLSRLRSFFGWLARERYLVYNPASELRLPKRQARLPVDSFSVDEVEQILAVPDVDEPLGLRDRAILETLYSSGLRRAEVARLEVYDVDFEREWLTVRQGKGGKDRVVPLGHRAARWLQKYLEDGRPQLVLHPDELAIFIAANGRRMTRDGLGNRVAQLIEASGVRPRRGACHLFRHTMATLMLENGADIRFLQEILGHAKLDTTQVYTKVSIEKLKQIHDATHPATWPADDDPADEPQ